MIRATKKETNGDQPNQRAVSRGPDWSQTARRTDQPANKPTRTLSPPATTCNRPTAGVRGRGGAARVHHPCYHTRCPHGQIQPGGWPAGPARPPPSRLPGEPDAQPTNLPTNQHAHCNHLQPPATAQPQVYEGEAEQHAYTIRSSQCCCGRVNNCCGCPKTPTIPNPEYTPKTLKP